MSPMTGSVRRRRRPATLVLLLALFGALLVWVRGAQAAEPDRLWIVTESGRYAFTVEVAATVAERARGLMFRRRLAPDAGMLFDYGDEQQVAMWMKNTFIPLDMLFIAGDGRIVNFAERTVPQSLAPIASAGPVRAVLEVNAGTVARLRIRPGDRVEHPIFTAAE